jgi:hypothetical protein
LSTNNPPSLSMKKIPKKSMQRTVKRIYGGSQSLNKTRKCHTRIFSLFCPAACSFQFTIYYLPVILKKQLKRKITWIWSSHHLVTPKLIVLIKSTTVSTGRDRISELKRTSIISAFIQSHDVCSTSNCGTQRGKVNSCNHVLI